MYADAPPPAVVVVSETAGFHHDSIPAEQDFLRSLSGLRVTVVDRVAQLTATRLRGVRAVVFASTSGDPPLSAAGRRVLLRYVRAGGGFVGIHSASDTYAHWPAFVVMLGGVRFAGHGAVEARRLTVTPDTVTRGLPATFTHTDEYYRFRGRLHARVVVRLGRAPLVWRRAEGDGRVFYSALGHPIGAWSEARHRRLVAQGLRWAMGAARR